VFDEHQGKAFSSDSGASDSGAYTHSATQVHTGERPFKCPVWLPPSAPI